MAEENSIFRVRPPHGSGGTDKQKGISIAYTVASSAELALGINAGIASPGEFVECVSTTDCHVAFGLTGMGAAVAGDFFLPAKIPRRFWCKPTEETHVRVIRDTADGTFYAYTPG